MTLKKPAGWLADTGNGNRHMDGTTLTARKPIDAALDYARSGWPILPLHSLVAGGCTCGRLDCHSPGKHPRTPHGLQNATTDSDVLRGWWRKWPEANAGVVTGAASGLVVLDIDPRRGAWDSLDLLQREHGELPATVSVATGGDGLHYYFQHPGEPIKNCSNGYQDLPSGNHGPRQCSDAPRTGVAKTLNYRLWRRESM